jgi:lysophospholipase L1-like esterase
MNANSASSVYDQAEWAESFWHEERTRWEHFYYPYEPFRLWGNLPWNGSYIHFDQTGLGVIRRTTKASPACPVTIWMFGGSTMWGQGSPDDMTIPSWLSRQANAGPGKCVTVLNFGVDAYNSTQELIFLVELLKKGKRPTIAIFYDGVNEAMTALEVDSEASAHLNLAPIRAILERGTIGSALDTVFEKSYSVRAVRGGLRTLGLIRPPQRPSITEQRKLKVAIVDNYECNLRIIRSIGREFGFRPFFFWQPMLIYGNKRADSFESHLLATNLDTDGFMANVYREVERRSSSQYVSLAHAFDGISQPIYIDYVHTGPEGNRILAEKIGQTIQADVSSAAAAPADARN